MDNIISIDAICLDERDCGCRVEWDTYNVIIVFCPLHEQAEAAAQAWEAINRELADAQSRASRAERCEHKAEVERLRKSLQRCDHVWSGVCQECIDLTLSPQKEERNDRQT